MPDSETSLWQIHRPRTDRCCLCGKQVMPAARRIEMRPTGTNGRVQEWTYCQNCWNSRVTDANIDWRMILTERRQTARIPCIVVPQASHEEIRN